MEKAALTDAQAFLDAVMDMAQGVLDQHSNYDFETEASHGPANHITISGAALDDSSRRQILDGGTPIRGGMVDTVFDNAGDGAVLMLVLDDGDDDDVLDVFVPLSASVVEAHTIVKTAVDGYVDRYFA